MRARVACLDDLRRASSKHNDYRRSPMARAANSPSH